MDFLQIKPSNIWSFRQNKPSYMVRDLVSYTPIDIIYRSLLARGVFKWLDVRRGIIKLKNLWKYRLREAHRKLRIAKAAKNWIYAIQLKGQIEAIEDCLRDVRTLCHSDRWQAPDFDKEAMIWIEEQNGGCDENPTP